MAALNGKYKATLNGQGSVYESDKGSLICALMVDVQRDDGGVLTLAYRYTLSTQEKGILTRNVNDLKTLLPEWDGGDIGALYDLVVVNGMTIFAGREVEAVCEPQQDKPQYTNIKFLNIPGRSSGASAPEAGDRKKLLAKFGSPFRAIAPPKRPAAPAAKPAAPKPPPAPKVTTRESTDVEAYNELVKLMPGKSDDEINAEWARIVNAAVPNKVSDAFTPADWGKVMAEIEKILPY